jgi:CheY-like chemotaxis protein
MLEESFFDSFSKPCVLIVDDDDYVRTIVECLVEDHYVVESAAGVDQALKKLATTAVDVLLLDYRLSGDTGLAVAHYAEQLGVPVVWMTGNAEGLNTEKHGIVLEKPFFANGLLVALASARSSKRSMSPC